ncbi:MAG: hypothetical protein LBR88_06390 [Zoogloeaceae bacterium]|jgi:hypothetical protein|nr:hypothetical protein [Zoogloeaceae bacterium]
MRRRLPANRILLTLGVVLSLLGGMARWIGDRHLAEARLAERQQTAQAGAEREAIVRWQALRLQKAALDVRWQALRQTGFFEPERHSPRLAWHAALRQVQAQEDIPVLTPRWQPAETLPATPALRRRAGTLHFALRHELQLPAALTALRTSVPALLRLRQCSMTRAIPPQGAARLTAECAVEWITGLEHPPLATGEKAP